MIKEPYVIFSEIVDSLRTIGTITDVVQNASGKYVVTADNSFKKNSVVSITNSNLESFPNLLIFEADSVSFVVDNDLNYDNQYTYQYKSDAPYFMHEEEKKAHDILAQKTSDAKWSKYPLVLLLHPYKVKYPKDDAYANVPELKIAIVNFATGLDTEGAINSATEKNSDQRYEDNFIPILDPIFDGIIEGIIKHQDSPVYVNTDLDYSNLDKLLLNDNPLPDLLDGKLLRINDFKIKYTCAAPIEVTKYQLKVSIVGDGETSPKPGTYSIEENKVVQIMAAENAGSEFVNWVVGVVEFLDRNIKVTMDAAKSAVATFQILLTGYYQDVMKGGGNNIVKDGVLSYFQNVGVGMTRMWIRAMQVLTLDGVGSYVDTGTYSVNATDNYSFNGKFSLKGTVATSTEYTLSFNVDNLSFLSYRANSGGSMVVVYNGALVVVGDVLLRDGTIYEWEINITQGNIQLILNGIEYNSAITNVAISGLVTISKDSGGGVSYQNGLLYDIEFKNRFKYTFQSGQDVIITDVSGNGNHGTVINPNLLQAWGTKVDEQDAYLFIYGYNKFQQIADPLIFVYKQHDINGLPTFTTLAGYNLIQSVAPNAGFSDTGSLVRQPSGDTVLNQVSQDYGLPFYGVSENDPQDVTHAEFKAIDLGAIPPEDFRYTISNDVISNAQTKVIV